MKKINIIILSFVLLLIVFANWFMIPQQYTKTLQGIYYQLGNESYIDKVNIHLDGKVNSSLFGKMSFEGTLDIDGLKQPVPKEHRQVKLNFKNDGSAPLSYTWYEDGRPHTFGYGTIFANNDLSEVTILKGNWNAENGLMITAPAKSRADALNISNKIMVEFLNGYELK